MPDRDEERKVQDELMEDDGVRYTGGDYDPSKVSARNSEYYAASSPEDSIDVIPGAPIEDDYESTFDIRRDERDARNLEQIESRPKEHILDDVNVIIAGRNELRENRISVEVNDAGEVTLKGVVDSEEMKRILRNEIEAVSGVRHVNNWIRVDPVKS